MRWQRLRDSRGIRCVASSWQHIGKQGTVSSGVVDTFLRPMMAVTVQMVSNAQVVVHALVLTGGGHDGGGVIGRAQDIQKFYGAVFAPCRVQQREQNGL